MLNINKGRPHDFTYLVDDGKGRVNGDQGNYNVV